MIPSEYWIEESDEKSLFFELFIEKTPKKDYRNCSNRQKIMIILKSLAQDKI